MEQTKSKVNVVNTLGQLAAVLVLGNAWGPVISIGSILLIAMASYVHARWLPMLNNEPSFLEVLQNHADDINADKALIQYVLLGLQLMAFGYWLLIVFGNYPEYTSKFIVLIATLLVQSLIYKNLLGMMRALFDNKA